MILVMETIKSIINHVLLIEHFSKITPQVPSKIQLFGQDGLKSVS